VDTAAEIEVGERVYRSQKERQQKECGPPKKYILNALKCTFFTILIFPLSTVSRETREGWPLLTVGT
jgi:hypothetical protein